MTLWLPGVRLPSTPPNPSSRVVALVLNSQDIQIIHDTWDHYLSLVQIKVHGKPNYPRGEIQTLSNRDAASLIRVYPGNLLGHLWLCLCMGLRVA